MVFFFHSKPKNNESNSFYSESFINVLWNENDPKNYVFLSKFQGFTSIQTNSIGQNQQILHISRSVNIISTYAILFQTHKPTRPRTCARVWMCVCICTLIYLFLLFSYSMWMSISMHAIDIQNIIHCPSLWVVCAYVRANALNCILHTKKKN